MYDSKNGFTFNLDAINKITMHELVLSVRASINLIFGEG